MSQQRRHRIPPWSSSPHPARALRTAALLVAGLTGSALVWAQPASTEGLRWSASGGLASATVLGPWSTRFGWADAPADAALANPVTARLSWQWLNDYRFSTAGGLRATGGVLGWLDRGGGSTAGAALRLSSGQRPAWAGGSGGSSASGDSLWGTPYLGLGYDTATPLRSGWGGWGLSADVGWVTRRAGTGGSGFRFGAQADAEDGWRSLRLAPMLQLGVSYAF